MMTAPLWPPKPSEAVDVSGSADVRNVVKIAARGNVRFAQVDRRRVEPVAHRENSDDRLDSARRTDAVPGHALRARNAEMLHRITERDLEHLRFRRIIELSRCPVSVIILNRRRSYARVFESAGKAEGAGRALRVRTGNVE